MAKIVFQDDNRLTKAETLDSVDYQMPFVDSMVIGDKLNIYKIADCIIHGHMNNHVKNVITNTLSRVEAGAENWVVVDREWKSAGGQITLFMIMGIDPSINPNIKTEKPAE